MKSSTYTIIDECIHRYPVLEPCLSSMTEAAELLISSFRSGGKLLVCGNGGSAADALHIVGELMKSFVLPRPLPPNDASQLLSISPDGTLLASQLQGALPAIALVGETALQTAYANDAVPELCFAQQVYGYGAPADTLLAISTSGSSANVVYAAETARLKHMHIIALTGASGGRLSEIADCTIAVPAKQTYQVQELHLPVYHCLCLGLEHEFFGEASR